MTGGETLRQILAGATAAGDKVSADSAEEGTTYPFVVFRRKTVDRTFGLDNTLLATRENFEIECWAETPSRAQALEQQCVDALLLAGIPPAANDPDAQDPEVGVNCVVLRADVWT